MVVGPVLPALQVLTPFNFSTFAEIIFRSVEQVIPLTFVSMVFVVSAVCTFSVTDCAKVAVVVTSINAIVKTRIFEKLFRDYEVLGSIVSRLTRLEVGKVVVSTTTSGSTKTLAALNDCVVAGKPCSDWDVVEAYELDSSAMVLREASELCLLGA